MALSEKKTKSTTSNSFISQYYTHPSVWQWMLGNFLRDGEEIQSDKDAVLHTDVEIDMDISCKKRES